MSDYKDGKLNINQVEVFYNQWRQREDVARDQQRRMVCKFDERNGLASTRL